MKKTKRCKKCGRVLHGVGRPNKSGYCTNCKFEIREKELLAYNRKIVREARKFKLTGTDLANLYDLFYIIDTPPEIMQDFHGTLKLNKLDKWFMRFRKRISKIIE